MNKITEPNIKEKSQGEVGGGFKSETPHDELFVKIKSEESGGAEAIQRPSVSYWYDAWLRIKKNKLAIASALFIFMLASASMFMPYILHYDHTFQEVWNKNTPPTFGKEAVVVDPEHSWYVPVVLGERAETGGDFEFSEEAPAAPDGVEVIGTPTSAAVAIKWNAVEGAESYQVYRSLYEDIKGIPQGETEADQLSFLDDKELTSGETYYYRVAAVGVFESSAPSQYVKVEPKLGLKLNQAQEIEPEAQIGEIIKTNAHYLGTDHLGRDILARILAGARISLFIGFVAPLLYIFFGVVYGAISGFIGGFVDDVMMRIADIVTTIPELLAVIMLQVFLGSGKWTLIIAMVLVAWSRSARQIRGEVLKLREMEFVHAAQVLGTPFRKTLMRHLLPNVSGTILVLFTLAIPQAIFTEAFLSFIGLGIAPPDASWGTITNEGGKVLATYPHQLLAPALMICFTMFAFNMLGDGLRDALDPKLRGAK
jgi:oligopeptide transport system permease protein